MGMTKKKENLFEKAVDFLEKKDDKKVNTELEKTIKNVRDDRLNDSDIER